MSIPRLRTLFGAALSFFLVAQAAQCQTPQWGRWETTITNTKTYTDPYKNVTLNVTYTAPTGSTINFWGFYDGGTTWKIRFMPHLVGTWSYAATFSDGQPGKSGTFSCTASSNFGTIGAYSTNPRWFGYKSGQPVLIRSFQASGLFKFAIDDPDVTTDGNERTAFLDWAATQGYNTFSAHFFSTRNATDTGGPKLWPLNYATYRKVEKVLNDLSTRKMMVYAFTGFFGNTAPYPSTAADRTIYIRYCLARFGPYWNIINNVGGFELRDYLTDAEINSLGAEIAAADPFDHLLGAHQRDGDDIFRTQTWCTYATLQHELTDLAQLSTYLLKNYATGKPVYGQETLWMGNTLQPAWTATDLRKHMWVHMMSAVAYNAADMSGSNDSGFSGTLVLTDKVQSRHDVPKMVWDFMQSIPFQRMSPRQDLRTSGYMLAEPGRSYLCYLPSGGSTSITLSGGPYAVTWINARNPLGDQRASGTTSSGSGLSAPDTNDWLLYLTIPTSAIVPEADTYVHDAAPTTNYANATTLVVKDAAGTGFDRISYLRFPVSGSSTSSTLKLKVVGVGGEPAGNRAVEVRQLLNDTWAETVTWNSRPATTGTLIATIPNAEVIGQTYSVNVSSYVNAQAADGKASFVLIQLTGAAKLVQFGSSESPGNQPLLERQ